MREFLFPETSTRVFGSKAHTRTSPELNSAFTAATKYKSSPSSETHASMKVALPSKGTRASSVLSSVESLVFSGRRSFIER